VKPILGTTSEGAAALTFLDMRTGEPRLGVVLTDDEPLIYMDGPGKTRGLDVGLRYRDMISEISFWDDGRERLYLGIGCTTADEQARLGVVRYDVDENGYARSEGLQQTLAARPPIATEPTTTPEDTLRKAGISNRRQARYQRRMSSLLAGRA
jgi:hypothetical protein